MRTAEEIAFHFGLCTCDEVYKSRDMSAPDCPWHSQAVEEAMIEYATEACKEQRKICERVAMKSNIHDVDKNILNAPLPELK